MLGGQQCPQNRAWDVNGEKLMLASPKCGCEIAVRLSSPSSPAQRRGIVSVACATFIVHPFKPYNSMSWKQPCIPSGSCLCRQITSYTGWGLCSGTLGIKLTAPSSRLLQNAQESHGVAVPTPSVPEDFEEKPALGKGSSLLSPGWR